MSDALHTVDDRSPEPPRTPRELLMELALVLPHLVLLTGRLLRDRRVPLRRKLVAAAAVVYVVSPIDLVPDVLPILGRVDDVIAVAFAVDHLLSGAPREVQHAYWDGSEDALDLVRAFAAWGAELVPVGLRRVAGR